MIEFERQGARSRQVPAGLLAVGALGILLTACIVTADQSIESDRKDPRAQDLMDRIRAIDLSPRASRGGEVDSPNPVRPSRPVVYVGDGRGQVNGSAPADRTGDAGGFDLNFENAPITTVAKVILGDILGVGYTIDPRIQGTITLTSGRSVPKSELAFVLENAPRRCSTWCRSCTIALGYRLIPANEAMGRYG